VSIPIAIAADAPATTREVTVNAVGGPLRFSEASAGRIRVGPGVPRFDSISPILGRQGEKVTLTIRGANLQGATAVTATPPEGIVFSSTWTVNATGTELTVDMAVAPDAPLGSRVTQVHVPGAVSTPDAEPANTFTVYAQ
jgi:hypothetical protein